MVFPVSNLKDLRKHFSGELSGYYDEKEVDVYFYLLIEEFFGLTKREIIMHPEIMIKESEINKIVFAIKDLKNYKPIQYIMGKQVFYNLSISVNPSVLIPRPETEELVDMVIKSMDKHRKISVLDVGTGSGCIAIALKKNVPSAEIFAIDISPSALEVAKQNAIQNDVEIVFGLTDILNRKLWPTLGVFDLIVSNPPYVRLSEKEIMAKNVLDYEPPNSIFTDDNQPLIFYEAIRDLACDHLTTAGSIFCEINHALAAETLKLFKEQQFSSTELRKDLYGKDRFLVLVR